MSDSSNPRHSSGDGDTVNSSATDQSKPSQRDGAEGSVKLRHQKPPVRAPKPKPRGKAPSDEDVVLKNFDDMLDRQEDRGNGLEPKVSHDQHSPLPTTEDSVASVTVNEQRLSNPHTDCDSSLSVPDAAAVESLASNDADTNSCPQSESSRCSIGDDDDSTQAPSSADSQNQASSSPHIGRSSRGRQV